MKKLLCIALAFVFLSDANAQKKKQKFDDAMNRAGDHIMLQLSSDHWMGAPDSVSRHIKSLSRGANIYVMMNRPFRGNPRMSTAFGIGFGTSNIFFKNMGVDIKSTTSYLPFRNQDTLNHFKKYKLTTAFLEVPVELRFSSNPLNDTKSIKAALGVKVGVLLSAHTKGKGPENKDGNSINAYSFKENSKRFLNSTRLQATARIGYGHYSLFGSYQITNIFKTGVATDIKLFQIGICVSGL